MGVSVGAQCRALVYIYVGYAIYSTNWSQVLKSNTYGFYCWNGIEHVLLQRGSENTIACNNQNNMYVVCI